MKFTDTLKSLEAKATPDDWQWDGHQLWHRGESYADKDNPHLFTGIEYDRRLEKSPTLQANAELIAFLRNHAQEIINLVEAAEKAMEHANFYVEADKEDDPLTRACTYGGMVSSIIDVLNPALAAMNKETS